MRFLLRLLVIVAVPVVLTMGVIRLVTLPWYPAWEYNKTNFPADPLGMERGERLRMAQVCIRFLNVSRGSRLLDDLRFPDGTQAFNARETGHMDDVKKVYDQMTTLTLLIMLIAIGAGLTLQWRWNMAELWGTLSDGGLLTLGLLILLGIWMVVGFEAFFIAFHGIFFEGDSWLFLETDTLIRLFPLQFWYDAGLLIAAIVGVLALGLGILGRNLQKRAGKAA
ncbi:MAG: TIGR01906 family membrane protein [Anaerolineae bacterium]|nr:TIGR01906 family membrane protein [Anaerolineae bacterium]